MNTNNEVAISIVRNSLAAAIAALHLLDKDSAPALGSAAPAQTTEYIPPEAKEISKFQILMQELQDPRYTLRSTRELADSIGVDYPTTVTNILSDYNIALVTKRRRSDGAELIGLLDRN